MTHFTDKEWRICFAKVSLSHKTTQHTPQQHNKTTRQQDNKTTRQQHHNTTTQHNTTQHNTTQHNTTQHNTTQHNTTQHNTTQTPCVIYAEFLAFGPTVVHRGQWQCWEAETPELPLTRCRRCTLTLIKTVQRFYQGGRWTLCMNRPQDHSESGSCLNFFLVVLCHNSPHLCLWLLSGPTALLHFCFVQISCFFTAWCRYLLWRYVASHSGK